MLLSIITVLHTWPISYGDPLLMDFAASFPGCSRKHVGIFSTVFSAWLTDCPHVSNIFFFCFAYSQFWMPYHDAFYRSISEPGWLTYLVIGITNKLHHPNNENSSPLHEEHALNAQSVARLVAQVFHFLHSCATICGRATVTLGRASLIIWRKATHFVESCH